MSFYIYPFRDYKDPDTYGWYKIRLANSPDNDRTFLRLGHIDEQLRGIVRFNKYTATFEGYNGREWVEFNATKGEKGDCGENFNSVVSIVNSSDGATITDQQLLDTATTEGAALVFKTLKGGYYNINGKLRESVVIRDMGSFLQVIGKAQPFYWSFANRRIDNMKGGEDIPRFKAFGNTEFWTAKRAIYRGQAVRITDGMMVEPLTFTKGMNIYKNNLVLCGIAINDAQSGESVEVCVNGGITTVKLSAEIPEMFFADRNIDFVGQMGFVGYDGYIFNPKIKPITTEYIKAGIFLETGNNGDYRLFKVMI